MNLCGKYANTHTTRALAHTQTHTHTHTFTNITQINIPICCQFLCFRHGKNIFFLFFL